MITIFILLVAFILQDVIIFKIQKRLDVLENENKKINNKLKKVVFKNDKNK